MDVKVQFFHGTHERLPAEKIAGRLLITDDKADMYMDIDSKTRIRIGEIEAVTTLPTAPVPKKIYLKLPNELWIYITEWVHLNKMDADSLLQFMQDNLSIPDLDLAMGRYSSNLSSNADESIWTETWTFNGKAYKKVLTTVTPNESWKTELFIDNVLTERWTLTHDSSGYHQGYEDFR